MGSVAATKYSGVIYAPLILVVILVPHLARGLLLRDDLWCKRDLVHLVYLMTAAIAVASPWYLRNVILWSNPIYPAEVEVLGITLFEGPMRRETLAETTLGWRIGPLIASVWHFFAAFGWLIPFFALGAMYAALSTLRTVRGSRLLQAAIGILACLLFVAFLHQPYNKPSFGPGYNMRYLLPWFALSLVATVGFIRNKLAAGLVMGVLAAATFVSISQWTRFWWVILVCAALAFVITKVVKKTIWNPLPQTAPVLWGTRAVVLVAVLTFGIAVDNQQKAMSYTDSPSSRGWGDVCNFVHHSISEERILVTGDARFFPIYGNHFGNSVTFLRGRHSALEVLNASRESDATMIVAFVPIAKRSGLTEYDFGESVGSALLREFPSQVEVVFQSKGAFVLKLVPYSGSFQLLKLGD